MGITQQFINMLGANEKETDAIIDKMSEKMAKQMLKVFVRKIKANYHFPKVGK